MGHRNFTVKLSKTKSKVLLKTIADHDKLKADLAEFEMRFHSSNQEQRVEKIVLKAASGLDTIEHSKQLQDNNIQPSDITPLKSKVSNNSYSYLVTLPKNS